MSRTWPNNAANRLKVGGNGNQLPNSGLAFTIAAWVRIESIPAAGGSTFISKYNGSRGPILRIIDSGTKNKLGLFCIQGNCSSGQEALGSTVLGTGVWTHIAGTWNGTSGILGNGTLAVWVNGVRDGTAAAAGMCSIDETTDGWTFGARAQANFPLDGRMCEMAIWNLDLSNGSADCPEIAALAKGVTPNLIRRPQLRGYWPTFGDFDNQIDFTGLLNNLVLVGTLNSADHGPVGPQCPASFAGDFGG